MNLRRHHVPVIGCCPLCYNPQDSTCHSLFYGPAVKKLWKDNVTFTKLKQLLYHDIHEVSHWLMDQMSKSDCEDFICHTWSIWSARCRAVHDNNSMVINNSKWSGKSLLEEYRQALWACSINHSRFELKSPSCWSTPPTSHLRLDVDASFLDSSNICGLGGAIRNHEGQLLAAFGSKITSPSSVSIGELMAIRKGLEVIRENNFHQVHISSDSLLAVQAVTSPFSDLSYAGLCAQGIKDLFDDLDIVEFFHVRRSANVVAHSISKFALSSSSPFYWVSGNFSSWLVILVTRDINIFQ